MTPSPGNDVTGGVSPIRPFVPEWLKPLPWEFITVVVITLVGVVISKYVVRLAGRPIAKRFRRQSVAQTVLRLLRLIIALFFFFFAASLVGLQLGNIVLSVTVFSAVLGIVLAPIVGSLISGVFVLADRPFEIGDMIELENGQQGFVEDITIRYTKIFTLDNTFLVIPNSNIRDQQISNFSAEDERTRLSLPVLVTYESDIEQARSLIERAAMRCDEVIEGGPDIRVGSARYPAGPTAYIDEFGDDGVLLTLRYWAKRPFKLLTVRSAVQTEIWDLLADEGADVEIAYPHQHLVFDETSGEAQVAVREAADRAADRDSVALDDSARAATEDAPGDADNEGDASEDDAADDATAGN